MIIRWAAGVLLLLAATPLHAAAPVIDDFSASATSVAPGGIVTLTVQAHDPDCPDTCTSGCGLYIRSDLTRWTATGGTFVSEDNGVSASPYSATAQWEAPATEGTYTITVDLSDSGTLLCGGRQTASDNLDILVTLSTNEPPVIESLTAVPVQLFPGETSSLSCVATDPDGDPVDYTWDTDSGTVDPGPDGTAVFTAGDPGVASVTCTASDPSGGFDSESVNLSVVGALTEKALVAGLVAPQRAAIDSTANVYVSDRAGGGLTVIHLFSGEFVYHLPVGDIRSVAVDWNDNLLVGGAHGAQVMTRRGQTLIALTPGEAIADVSDVAVDQTNRRYGVLHRSAGRVVVYDDNGARIAAFGSTGDGPDQLKSPLGLAVRNDGNWVVADKGHGEVKVFDLSGNLLSSFGALGGGAGEFVGLGDVAVDSAGLVHTTDSFQDWVQTFNSDGTLRENLGTFGDLVGQFKTPTGLATAEAFDRLLVVSANSSSVQVFVTRSDAVMQGPRPEASHAPTGLVFGPVAVGASSAPLSVTLTNRGDAPLGVRDIAVTGDFAQSNDCGPFVDPGGTCSFQVTFAPTVPGGRDGSMTIDTSATGGGLVVALSGSGFVPAGVNLRPGFYEYPDQLVDTVSDPVPVRLANIGTEPLSIHSITASADYIQNNDCPGMLAGGGFCTIQVRFAPVNPGDHIPGSVTVNSNAAGSPHVVSLDGRGAPAEASVFISDVTVTETDAGSTEAEFEVTLTEAHSLTVTVDYATVSDTATEGEDFEGTSGTLSFLSGETRKMAIVQVLGDVILEPDEENFLVELSNPVNGILRVGQAAGTIVDDESCPGPNLLVNPGAEDRPGMPGWLEPPTSVADWQGRTENPEPYDGRAYFFAGASTTDIAELYQDISVSAFGDAIDAGAQRFVLEGYVRSGDETPPDTARIVVEYRRADGHVLATQDFGEVSSPLGWLRVGDEHLAPPQTSVIRVRLISTRHSGTDNDGYFDALSLRSLRAATLVVEDASDDEGDSGAHIAYVPVTLSCPYHREVRFDFETADGTALMDQDYLPTAGTGLISIGETSKSIGVTIIGDRENEAHETVLMKGLIDAPEDVVPLDMEGILTIVNDDFCPRRASFWINHPALWPVDFMDIGGVEYDDAGMTELLGYKGGNISSLLAGQLIAAKLNLAMGSDRCVAPTVEQADVYLAQYPPGSELSGSDKKVGKELLDDLKDYNESRCAR